MKNIYPIVYILLCLLGSPIAQAQFKQITINHGSPVTNIPDVTLHLKHPGATEMKLWNGLDSAVEASAPWQAYRPTLPWTLPANDGKKIISVKFRDASGQFSEQYIDAILYDTQAPQIDSVKVGDSLVTREYIGITISLYVTEAYQMMVSNDAGFKYAGWESYKQEFRWTLTTGDGDKQVYFKFKDIAGNVSEVISKSIILDTRAPSEASITIIPIEGTKTSETSGILHVNDPNRTVNLKIHAEDAAEMMIANDISFYGHSWQAYSDTLSNWKFSKETDGIYYVYARFKDAVGNISKAVVDRVIFDTQRPVLRSVSINKKDTVTNNTDVTLYLDSHGADLVKIANNKDLSAATTYKYSPEIPWKLSMEDGRQEFYVVLLDSAQNASDTVRASIRLDTQPPTPLSIILEEGKSKRIISTQASVSLKASEAAMMQVDISPDFENAPWHTYHEDLFNVPLGDQKGTRWIYARFKDEAGNFSETIKDSLISEEVALFSKIMIDSDAEYCTDTAGVVTINIEAVRANEMMVSNHPRFLRAKWEPIKASFSWQLAAEEDGDKEVFMKVRSVTETESAVLSDKIILDRSKPHDCSIDINKGEISTFNHRIQVEPKAQDAQHMLISTDPSFKGASWKYYDPSPTEITISKSPGWKRVYAKFKDDIGNISEVVFDSILMELRPVAGKIRINDGAEFCTEPSKEVRLTVQAQHATEMIIGRSPDFAGSDWQVYEEEKTWILPGEDGTKIVYIKFRSVTGTESDIYTDYIILDRKPPFNEKLTVSKTRAGEAISPHHVYVGAFAEDAVAMQVGLSDKFHPKQTWHSYTDVSFLYNIGKNEGDLQVFMRFKDVAGNISEPISQAVNIDRTKPEDLFIGLEGGLVAVNTIDVMLELQATGATQMRFNTVPVFNDLPWEPFATKKAWTLSKEDGTKAIYVQFRDAVGNASRAIGTKVELDRDAPIGESINVKEDFCINKERIVNLQLKAYGSSMVLLSHNPTFEGATWIRYRSDMKWRLPEEDASYTLYAKFSDEAGNETEVFTDKVILDREAPKGSLIINAGDAYTDKLQVNLSIGGDDPTEMLISNAPNFIPASSWMPYAGAWSWKLNDGRDGTKKVYIKFRDEAGNESIAYTDSIMLDRAGPIVKSVLINNGATAVKGQKVVLHSKVEGAKFMMVSDNSDFKGAVWEPYFEEKNCQLKGDEGEQKLYVKFKDHLGHETPTSFSDGIMVYKKLYYISK